MFLRVVENGASNYEYPYISHSESKILSYDVKYNTRVIYRREIIYLHRVLIMQNGTKNIVFVNLLTI